MCALGSRVPISLSVYLDRHVKYLFSSRQCISDGRLSAFSARHLIEAIIRNECWKPKTLSGPLNCWFGRTEKCMHCARTDIGVLKSLKSLISPGCQMHSFAQIKRKEHYHYYSPAKVT